MAKKVTDIECAICGKVRKMANKDKLVDEGWAIVQGNGAPHYFCPDETPHAQVQHITKMCIGISGSRGTKKHIRESAIIRERGNESARVLLAQSQADLLPKRECAMCKGLFIERLLEVNDEEKLLCSGCMSEYLKMRKEIYKYKNGHFHPERLEEREWDD